MVVVTELVCGSILTIASSRLSATQTAPPPTTSPVGPWPTGIGAATKLLDSMRDTEFSRTSLTQALPRPMAMPLGALPTASFAPTPSERGSIRVTDVEAR